MLMLVVIFVSSAFFFWYVKNANKMRNCPPGPFQFPIIGNIPQMAAIASPYPSVAFDKLSKKYGNIMSLKLGITDGVVLSDSDIIKDILSMSETADRTPDNDMLLDRSLRRQLGIVFTGGESWKVLHKFTIRKLRDFGLGKSLTMEAVINNEAQEFIGRFKKHAKNNDGIVRIESTFMLSSLNIIWSLVTGNPFNIDDPQLQQLMFLSNQLVKSTNFATSITLAFPILRRIFPKLSGREFQLRAIKELHDFMRDVIHQYRDREGRKSNPQNFIDLFINQMEAESSNPDSFFTEDHLMITLLDLFQAGSETTAEVLSFGVLYLILNPSCQTKLQEEIDKILPNGTTPTLVHQSAMVYTQATIFEMLRMGNVVPIPGPRIVMKEFYYKGYLFRKGVSVMPNFHSVFTDDSIWGDSLKFRPERFISAEGTLDVSLCEKVSVLFGHGARKCIGDSLAMTTLFLFVTALFQQVTFKMVPGQLAPTTSPKLGLSMAPYPFDVLVSFKD